MNKLIITKLIFIGFTDEQANTIFIIKGFRTIVFIFSVISLTFRPVCPLAFFRCLSNTGTYTELAGE